MVRRSLILTATLLALSAAAAGAASAPSWNSGYKGWWPAGFGYPPITVQSVSKQCSVTVYGPTFHEPHSGSTQDYGGGTSCASGVGTKTLTIYDQVLGQDARTWYTISGSKFTAGPSNGNPLRMIRKRLAHIGHVYRSVATAELTNVPNGHAGCSLSGTCNVTYLITATSRRIAP
jgi:hypothetical protein